MIYDFKVTDGWHQLCLFNGKSADQPTEVQVPLSGEPADGALGLDPAADYWFYDFWNDVPAGKLKGSDTLRQQMRAGEARMLSIHKAQDVPQFISTNRHLMQGYLDLLEKPEWKKAESALEGVSAVVANDPYELVFACNGLVPRAAKASVGEASLGWKDEKNGIGVLTLKTNGNAEVRWRILFQ
jgi:hypothetical protein